MTSDTTNDSRTREDGNETESATTTGGTDHPHPEAEPLDESPVSLDSVFNVLQNERRRIVLRHLVDQDGPVSVGDLSEYVAAMENAKSRSALTSQERKRVYVGLYQSHLPTMDDAGFIEYDKSQGSIERGPQARHAERYLQLDEPAADPWPTYYLGLVGVGCLIVLGSFVVGPLATTVAVGVFLASMTTLALVHAYNVMQEPSSPSFDSRP